jgi:hypothetical protein
MTTLTGWALEVNRDYLATTVCVKRNIKNNCCKAQCFIDNQKKQANEKPSSQKTEKKSAEVQWFTQTLLYVVTAKPIGVKGIVLPEVRPWIGHALSSGFTWLHASPPEMVR